MSSGRQFVVEVIELYKELPCLWKVTDPNYHDKQKRNLAMEQLVELFKTQDENATKETVNKKIGSMRSSFRKEHNKVKASQKSGAGTDEVHVPKLWYYDLLTFLDDQETPRTSKNVSSILDSMPFGGDEDYDEDSSDTATQLSSSSVASSSREQTTPQGFKRPRSKADQVLEKIAKRMDQPIDKQPVSRPKEKHDSFGEHVAEKLRSLPPDMVPYCQKMINEAIFLAETGNLNISSRIVTDHYTTPPATQNNIMTAYTDAMNTMNDVI